MIAIQEKNIRRQQEELSAIENTIQILSSERNSPEIQIGSSGSSDGENAELEDEDSDDDSQRGLSDPIWDQSDDVFRCTVCSWEVIDGFCDACMMAFKWNVVRDVFSCLLRY